MLLRILKMQWIKNKVLWLDAVNAPSIIENSMLDSDKPQYQQTENIFNLVAQENTDALKSEVIKEIDEVEKIQNKDDYSSKKLKIFEIIKHFIFNRTNFEYGYADVVQYFLWCIFIRNKIKVKIILLLRVNKIQIYLLLFHWIISKNTFYMCI